ncbi:MAG: phosphoribosylformylglycinamidine synthase subunit PurQ [Planctomycetes bacterium]|nr:phosphoribosylformylglycinamidine synthase subunit PurQ [Planctomycetota bacterium]
MAQVRILILRAAGINCDLETEHAWETAGGAPERVHIRRLIERPQLLTEYQILTIPGGFSYGDDIAAGRILAAQLERHLLDQIRAFVVAEKLVLGICNGFQVLVRTGLLPFSQAPEQARTCTITYNEPPGFQDRWVWLRADTSRCPFLEPGHCYELPIAHGEGRVMFADADGAKRLLDAAHGALRYIPPPDGPDNTRGDPYNPNGSAGDIAGLCDETGRVLGLMPHPERFVSGTQHPRWTSRAHRETGDGMALFRRAIAHLA